MFSDEKVIIMSVGGSLIIPNGGIDRNFLTEFNSFIRKEVAKGKRFMLVIGGGNIMRHYRDAATHITKNISDEDLDWLAIHITRVNAHLLRTMFYDIAHPRIIENYDHKLEDWTEPIAIGAGWKPGWSTDYDAVILARDYGGKSIINLSNIDYVFDKDPNKFTGAKKIENITWTEMEKIVGNEWTPGLNLPFDPVATKLAKQLGLTVVIANGKNFSNVDKIISGKKFIGTIIHP